MSSLLNCQRLEKIIRHFSCSRIAVLGDFFLDKYLDIDPQLEEISVETGKPAHQVALIRCSPGAAGTVVSNLAALSAGTLHAVGFTGNDGEGWELRRGLTELGCSTDHLHTTMERFTPTYMKPRNNGITGLAGEHSRIDTKNRQPTPAEIEQAIIGSVSSLAAEVDAIIVMDQTESQNCGAVTTAVRNHVSNLATNFPHLTVWADSRRRIREFRNVIIKPNEFEAVGNDAPLPGDTIDVNKLQTAAMQLSQRTNAPVFVTRGSAGMFVTDPEWTSVPGVQINGETDTTGAGDSATAGCVLALCSGATCPEAAVVGNLVASITVQQLDTTGTANQDQLPARLELWNQQSGQTDLQ